MKKKLFLSIIFFIFVPFIIFSEAPEDAMQNLLSLFRSYNITSVPQKIEKNKFEGRILLKVKKDSEKNLINNLYSLSGENYLLKENITADEKRKITNLFHRINFKELTSEQIKENKIISGKIEEIFDYQTLLKGALQDQWNKMSIKQQDDFYNKFKSLVELIAYPQGSYFYSNSKNDFKKTQYVDNKAIIASKNYNIDKDLDITISYIFKETDGRWKLVDVEMNDHSLIDAYRLQINRIAAKNGLEGLMDILNKKYKELIE